nr:YiiG family protein [Actinomycetota bacterium]NIS31043.1 YiiG family protein [Actinomycetota bacterium]NIW28021.1 hypothetical protein [Actinomycetota bacterium]
MLTSEAATVERGRALLAEAPSLADLDAVARSLLDALRARGPLATLDAHVHDEREEILDDPAIDPLVRERSMLRLEAL